MILNIRDIDLKCHFILPKIGLPKIKTLTSPMYQVLFCSIKKFGIKKFIFVVNKNFFYVIMGSAVGGAGGAAAPPPRFWKKIFQ